MLKKSSVIVVIAAALFGLSGTVPADEAKVFAARRAIFKVDNLSCGSCLRAINQGLSSMDGFSGMGTNLFRRRVAVDFVDPLSAQKLGQAITGLGYPATLDSVAPVTQEESFAYLQALRRGSGTGAGCCAPGITNAGCNSGNAPPPAN